jgi:hypothetical protein
MGKTPSLTSAIQDIVKRTSKKPAKVRTTFLINKEQYLKFKKICNQKGVVPSHAVDELIGAFIEHAGR